MRSTLATICFGLCASAAALAVPASVPNFRDLGSMRSADGRRQVRPGVLLRSATPANITQADVATLHVQTVLDLRSETDAQKDVGTRLLAPSTVHIALLDEPMMREALLKRAKLRPFLFARLLTISIIKRLSPSRRLRTRCGTATDIRLARLFGA